MDRFIKSATAALLLVNTAFFVLLRIAVAVWGDGAQQDEEIVALLGMRLPNPWPWTPLTYMFTHAQFSLFFFNMVWLICIGRIFEMAGTRRRLWAAYISGGLFGAGIYAVAWAMGIIPSDIPLLGASAAVVGITTCGAVMAPKASFRLLVLGDVNLMWIGIITVILSLFPALTGEIPSAISHLGGAIGGALAGLAMAHGWLPRFSRRDIKRKADAMTLDELLDKIRRSGYKSLTKAESARLLELSKKL